MSNGLSTAAVGKREPRRGLVTLYEKLPPGPGLSAYEVAARQRARLRGAMIEAVASHGFRTVTVRELCALAGVSTRTFYEHFAGKEACLIASYQEIVRRAALRMRTALGGTEEPRERLRLALEALAREIADHPAAAHLALLEAPAAGPKAAAEVRRCEAALSSLVADCLTGDADGAAAPPRIFSRAIVAGATHVLRSRLIAGRERDLPELAGELADWAYACGVDAAAAPVDLDPPSSPPPGCGPPPLSREKQPADERALILSAASQLAARDGYEGLSVPRIRAAAGVSRKSFDSHFADLDDCFLTACAVVARRALADAAREAASARRWAAGVQRALLALFAQMCREPERARLALLEVLTPGPDGIRLRAGLVADATALLLTTVPENRRPSEPTVEASVGAVWEIACQHVAEGRLRRLHRLAPTLTQLLAAPVQRAQDDTHASHRDRRSGQPSGRFATGAAA